MRGIATASHGIDAEINDRSAVLARIRTFHTVDLLRGLGAALIVVFHAGYIYGLGRPAEAQYLVDLFFVMSGFVIPFRYEGDLHAGMPLSTFAKIRFVRLYPLFLLGSLLGVVPSLVAIIFGHHDAFHLGLFGSLPLAVFMLPSTFVFPRLDTLYPLNYVAWSLTLELVVNIAYAASFRFWTVRRVLALAGIMCLALVACAVHFGTLDGGFAWPDAMTGPVRAIFGFAVGLILYRVHQKYPFDLRLPWWLLVCVILGLCLLPAPINKPAWDVALVVVAGPFLVFAAIAIELPRRLHGLCAIGGLYSYVIYSLHVPLIGLFLYSKQELFPGAHTGSLIDAALFTLIVTGGSVAAHLYFDKPIRRFLSKRWIWPNAKASDHRGAISTGPSPARG